MHRVITTLFTLFAAVACTVLAAGCQHSPKPAAEAPATTTQAADVDEVQPELENSVPAAETSSGSWRVYVDPNPEEFPVNETFTIEIRLQPQHEAVRMDDVQMTVDAAMPHHGHGMVQQPSVRRINDHTWIAENMLLHMPGRWEIYFDITHGTQTERAQSVIVLE